MSSRVIRTRADQKLLTKMGISVNTIKVKYTEDKPMVIYNSVLKALGYFKLFKCGEEFFNNMDAAMYRRACMETALEKY